MNLGSSLARQSMFDASGLWWMERSCSDSDGLESELLDVLLSALSLPELVVCCCPVSSSESVTELSLSLRSLSRSWLNPLSLSGVAGREGVPNRSMSEGIGVGVAHLPSLTDDQSEWFGELLVELTGPSRKLVSILSAHWSQLISDGLGEMVLP